MSADTYYKSLLSEILGNRWRCQFDFHAHRKVQIGPICADLDGVIVDERGSVICAVEIESRNAKQIRGSMLDLALHSAPKKLLLIDPSNIKRGKSMDERVRDCQLHFDEVWRRLQPVNPGQIEIVVLDRNGKSLVSAALERLGILVSA